MILLSITLFLMGFPFESTPFTLFGIFFAWIYLRFYQIKLDNYNNVVVIGDMNPSFSLSNFFPEPIQYIIHFK